MIPTSTSLDTSAIEQLPAIMAEDKVAIVVTPLLALMHNQVCTAGTCARVWNANIHMNS